MTDPRLDNRVLGLYVHFPWCIKKCPYCDFNSHPLKDNTDQEAYLQALRKDWQQQYKAFAAQRLAQTPSQQFNSVFFGGGTPSLFRPELLQQLLSEIPHQGAEVTLEVNPGTAEYYGFSDYLEAGINRLSIGAQSFADPQLAALGRVHCADETRQAYARARQAGFSNINIDLMWGLPGQSVEAALADLRQAIALQPEHISWYQLTIEAKTEFAMRPPILPKDALLQEIEEAGLALLAAAGWQRYEVSAFAKPGKQCQHNLTYWSFGDYLGIGAGAHGKFSRDAKLLRTQRRTQPRLYQQDPCNGEPVSVVPDQLTLEFMMNALRLIDGVSQDTFAERTHITWSSIEPIWQGLAEQGLVTTDRCATTALGLRYLDSVLERFL
jgi:oxygen-independent coproporphyrinogen-3 oxidase